MDHQIHILEELKDMYVFFNLRQKGSSAKYIFILMFYYFYLQMQNWMATNKFYKTYLPTLDNIASKYFHGYPPIEEIMKSRTEIVFLNSHTAMGLQRHMSPSFIQVGGMHISNPKSLPKELEEFISSAEHGVIYFSLGTFVRYDSLDPKIIGNILKVFGKLKQKVLWKWSGTIENIPNNVMVSKWVPQQDILSKLSTFLFFR